MQRASFDAIMRDIRGGTHTTPPAIRFSLRNSEVYTGKYRALAEAPDVIVVDTATGDIHIALTAIATIGRFTP